MTSQKFEHLTVAQAAVVLGVSTSTVKRIVKSGRLPEIYISEHHRRYRREDIEALLAPIIRGEK